MTPRMGTTTPAPSAAHVQQDKGIDVRALIEEITAKTPTRYDAGRFAPRHAGELWDLARDWYWSGLLPAAYYPKQGQGNRWDKQWVDQGVGKAVVVMRYGASLGVLPEQAIRQIYIVENQPSPSAALMLSIAIANGVLRREDWRIVEASRERCVIEVFGTSRAKPEKVVAAHADYKHLHHKDNWKNYPEDMLVARATSRTMRRYFPDMFAGVYAVEERLDMRQDRAAGLIEDPVDRIMSLADAPSEPEEAPPPTAAPEATPVAPDPLADAAALAEQVKALYVRIEALGPGMTKEAQTINEAVKALPECGERRGLWRAWVAKERVVQGEGGGA
jgi:hypothetical protein